MRTATSITAALFTILVGCQPKQPDPGPRDLAGPVDAASDQAVSVGADLAQPIDLASRDLAIPSADLSTRDLAVARDLANQPMTMFNCDQETCSAPSEWCYIVLGGAVAVEARNARPAPDPGCNLMPTACVGDVSCSCLEQYYGANTGCGVGSRAVCSEQNGEVTITCFGV